MDSIDFVMDTPVHHEALNFICFPGFVEELNQTELLVQKKTKLNHFALKSVSYSECTDSIQIQIGQNFIYSLPVRWFETSEAQLAEWFTEAILFWIL